MPKTRNVYKDGTTLKSMCRICLTQSNNIMFKLKDQLTGDNYNEETYLEALERVTFCRVDINGQYPDNICPMCVSFLKMALEFITQFETSQKKLQNLIKTKAPANKSVKQEYNSTNDKEEYVTGQLKYDPNDSSNVELIIKDKKFNLNEVLVVEKHEKSSHDYKGFINKLGNEISATIVSGSNRETTTIDHKISVIKVETDEEIYTHQSNDENEDEEEGESIKVIVESADEQEENIKDEIETPSNLQSDHLEDQDNIEVEEHSYESDSQRTSENDNLEYIEIDMFDKDAIESFIIDRSKLSDSGDCPTAPTRKRGLKDEEEKDEFFKEVKFPCEICKKVYQTKHSLQGHLRRAHTDQNQKTFTCEMCGTVCRSRSAFVNHKLKHFDKQFKCDLCDKAYTTKAHLKVHMSTHTNIRPFLCNVCGKDFNYANALTYHMRLHTGEKNYHCEYCPKRFRMINSLNRHLRTHTGEKPYKCQFCGRDFSSKGEVVCHEYIHTGYRPYHCKYCKKGFSKTHNLKIHLLSHGGPYHCQFCNKTFIEEKILTMHHKISHKDLLPEERGQECTDEESQDGATSQYGVSYDSSIDLEEENLKIELIEEEDSDTEFVEDVNIQMEEDNSE